MNLPVTPSYASVAAGLLAVSVTFVIGEAPAAAPNPPSALPNLPIIPPQEPLGRPSVQSRDSADSSALICQGRGDE